MATPREHLPEGDGGQQEVDGVDRARPHPEHPEGRDAEDGGDDAVTTMASSRLSQKLEMPTLRTRMPAA